MTYPSRLARALPTLLLLVYVVTTATTAWIGDDAYITLRTVDNFLHGYGLTWNPPDRVQAYTHALWMFMLTGATFITGEAYFSTIILSLICSWVAVTWMAWRLCGDPCDRALLILMLVASCAMVDYSTSGLENPASYLLLGLFCSVYLRSLRHPDQGTLFGLGLLAALVVLNRTDLLLLVAPALAERLYTARSMKAVAMVAVGFLPLVAWEAFSLLYYGSLVPNTAYAKLSTGVPKPLLIRQGLRYGAESLRWDPATCFVLAAGVLAAVWRRRTFECVFAAGIVLYGAYVVWVGGDFMRGRFLAAPVILAAPLLARLVADRSRAVKAALAGVIIVLGLYGHVQQYLHPAARSWSGITDERGFYSPASGIFNVWESATIPNHEWSYVGEDLRAAGTSPYVVADGVGFLGYFAGPDIHIIDQYALSDPLLARLPIPDPTVWRIGHFKRPLPDGYFQTVATGRNELSDPVLSAFYDDMQLVLRAPLFDRRRLEAIWTLNACGRHCVDGAVLPSPTPKP